MPFSKLKLAVVREADLPPEEQQQVERASNLTQLQQLLTAFCGGADGALSTVLLAITEGD